MAEGNSESDVDLNDIELQAQTTEESDDDGDIIPPGEKPFSYSEWFEEILKDIGF